MKLRISLFFKKLFLALSLVFIGAALWYYADHQAVSVQQELIYDFDQTRDMPHILDFFKKNWYWLIADGDYSEEYILSKFLTRSPNKNPLYRGAMHIKVLRKDNDFIGFVTYFKNSPLVGQLLFLGVRPEFRGKRYAALLIDYVLSEFKKMGVKKVWLVTRTDNSSAQKLYNRSGFHETSRTHGFVYFAKYLS